jgi:hypothetical protein
MPTETTTAPALPADRFDLREMARETIGSREWVLYSDGVLADAIPADDFDEETEQTDYSLWCSSTTTGGRHEIIALMRASGIDHVNSGACGGVSLDDEE